MISTYFDVVIHVTIKNDLTCPRQVVPRRRWLLCTAARTTRLPSTVLEPTASALSGPTMAGEEKTTSVEGEYKLSPQVFHLRVQPVGKRRP